MTEITIPNYRLVQDVKPHYVYTIRVSSRGCLEYVEKRYSAFHSFHRELRKFVSTPPFPSKRIRCSQPKVLEQRRAGLERYLQTVFKIEDGCLHVMDFLGLKCQPNNRMNVKYQRPIFHLVAEGISVKNAHNQNSCLPDIITEGVLRALYL
ncbi:sorting nexin-24-like [Daktulosphaira vitifoliae]|uniref:sorting nexin-24-like n=1 Tax=Daktulosphaira vitifoliae TaxID=58002 RepID=UPI0021AAB7F5|nr:sorting nexin-24-like [Daktulosphaira vitifoliae]